MQSADRHAAVRLARQWLCRSIDAALEALAGSEPGDAEVHAARRELKRARSLLRLLRAALQPAVYGHADLLLRGAGRSLARRRDAAALALALERIRVAAGVRRQSVAPLVRALARERRDGSPRRAVPGARRGLALARRRLLRARLTDGGASPLSVGFVRIYRRGRRQFAALRDAPTASALHTWRRHVKRYWHALEVLASGSPRVIGALAREAHALADLLGEDHDLALLDARLATAPLAVSAQRRLRAVIGARRTRLGATLLEFGAQLYADPPRQHGRRAAAWWRRWAKRVAVPARRRRGARVAGGGA